ncbi:hypothetical protein CYMTET_35969, partial [Cymbomonas tetramitiformis]
LRIWWAHAVQERTPSGTHVAALGACLRSHVQVDAFSPLNTSQELGAWNVSAEQASSLRRLCEREDFRTAWSILSTSLALQVGGCPGRRRPPGGAPATRGGPPGGEEADAVHHTDLLQWVLQALGHVARRSRSDIYTEFFQHAERCKLGPTPVQIGGRPGAPDGETWRAAHCGDAPLPAVTFVRRVAELAARAWLREAPPRQEAGGAAGGSCGDCSAGDDLAEEVPGWMWCGVGTGTHRTVHSGADLADPALALVALLEIVPGRRSRRDRNQ